MLHRFRMWDRGTVVSVDRLVANSDFVRRRIARVYGREAVVVHPPVDVQTFTLSTDTREDRYVTAGRFVPYKNTATIIEAFAARPALHLDVIGTGPQDARLRAMAPPNVTFTGWLPRDEVVRRFQRARAFVFAAIEDFGIVPVEAQACGTPVIAPSLGGTAETVCDLSDANHAPTGILYDPGPGALAAALDRFETAQDDFDPHIVRAHAETFAAPVFRAAMRDVVDGALAAHGG
jgi:glycosyltransferase involved in cell wall biosynthesis